MESYLLLELIAYEVHAVKISLYKFLSIIGVVRISWLIFNEPFKGQVEYVSCWMCCYCIV